MKIIGVNGIRTHGEANIDLLLGEMKRRGFETIDVRLPMRNVFTARFGAKKEGELIADHSDDGDIIVMHSHGNNRGWHAHQIRNYALIVCIAPAMSRRAKWRNPERVYCWHSREDWAVRLGSILPLHIFGPAGAYGFLQPGINNRSAPGAGHGDYFRGDLLQRICNEITAAVRKPATCS